MDIICFLEVNRGIKTVYLAYRAGSKKKEATKRTRSEGSGKQGTDTHINRQTDRRTDKHTNRQTNRRTDKEINRQRDG